MADISKITLPSGNTYDIKDATARQMISGGVSFIVAWAGNTTPVVANIPAGVVVKYNGTSYTGTLTASADTTGKFYLVKSETAIETLDVYDEYVTVGTAAPYSWEKIGDTQIVLTNVVTEVSLNKDTATAITGYASPSTDTFIKSLTVKKGTLSTTTVPNVTGNTSVSIPNVTAVGTASSWQFAMGTGANAETLIISGTNSTTPTLGANLTATNTTLGTAKTVATGAVTQADSGDFVYSVFTGTSGSAITGLGTASTATVLTNNTSLTVTKGS